MKSFIRGNYLYIKVNAHEAEAICKHFHDGSSKHVQHFMRLLFDYFKIRSKKDEY